MLICFPDVATACPDKKSILMYVTSLFQVLPQQVTMEAIREVEMLPRHSRVTKEEHIQVHHQQRFSEEVSCFLFLLSSCCSKMVVSHTKLISLILDGQQKTKILGCNGQSPHHSQVKCTCLHDLCFHNAFHLTPANKCFALLFYIDCEKSPQGRTQKLEKVLHLNMYRNFVTFFREQPLTFLHIRNIFFQIFSILFKLACILRSSVLKSQLASQKPHVILRIKLCQLCC